MNDLSSFLSSNITNNLNDCNEDNQTFNTNFNAIEFDFYNQHHLPQHHQHQTQALLNHDTENNSEYFCNQTLVQQQNKLDTFESTFDLDTNNTNNVQYKNLTSSSLNLNLNLNLNPVFSPSCTGF